MTFSLASYSSQEALRVGALTQSFVAQRDGANARPILLKQLLPAFASNPVLRARWLARAEANARVHPEGSVHVYESGEADGDAYMAVELVSGVGLDVLMRKRRGAPADLGVAVHVATSILRALATAHENGLELAHLDIAPESVVVRDDGSVVITEHGMWDALLPAEASRARFDRGRVAYLSPELAKSLPGDARSDVFSTGALLFELLAGSRPHAGPTQLVLALAIAEGKRRTMHDAAPGVPEPLRDVVELMLAHAADERFQSARAALNALSSSYETDPGARERLATWVAGARSAPASAAPSRLAPTSSPPEVALGVPSSPPLGPQHAPRPNDDARVRTRVLGSLPTLGPAPESLQASPPNAVVDAPPPARDGAPRTDLIDMAELLSRAKGSQGATFGGAAAPNALGGHGASSTTPTSEPLPPPPLVTSFGAPPVAVSPSLLAPPPLVGRGEPTPPPLVAPPSAVGAAPPFHPSPTTEQAPGLVGSPSGDVQTAFFKRATGRHKLPSPLPPPGVNPPPTLAPAPAPLPSLSALAPPAPMAPPAGFGSLVADAPRPGASVPMASASASGTDAPLPQHAPPELGPFASSSRGDERWRDPSRTLFEMKSYAQANTVGAKRRMPLALAVALAVIFSFALVAGGYLLFRLFS